MDAEEEDEDEERKQEEEDEEEEEEELTVGALHQAAAHGASGVQPEGDDALPLLRLGQEAGKQSGGGGGGDEEDEDEPAPGMADLPHDAASCLICSTAEYEEAEGEAAAARLLLRLPDLVFLVWDYLPLSQVWRFQHLCPLWKERLQLKPQPPQLRQQQTQHWQREVEMEEEREEEAAAAGAAALVPAVDDDAAVVDAAGGVGAALPLWRAEGRAAALRWRLEEEEELIAWGRLELERLWLLDEQRALMDWDSGRHRRRGGLGGRHRGRGPLLVGAEQPAAANTAPRAAAELWLQRGRDRGERTADWRDEERAVTAKRARTARQEAYWEEKEEKRDDATAAAAEDDDEREQLQPSRGSVAAVAAQASRFTRLSLSSSGAESSERAAAAPPSSSSSSPSPSPAASAGPPSIACWSSRSYLHRLQQASLSVLPHCTPCLSHELLDSLSSLTSLHLYSFPFVYPVFLAEREGGGREQDAAERQQLQAEIEAYENWERRQEARRDRKLMRDSCDALARERKEEERQQREAQQQQRLDDDDEDDDEEEEEEEQQEERQQRPQRQAHRRLRRGERLLVAPGRRQMQADEVWLELPGNGFLLRLQHAQQRDRLQQHIHLAQRARQAPEDTPSPLLALAAVASQLTALVYTAPTLLSGDIRELSHLTRLTSLSLHPAHGELIRPVELIDSLFGALPELRLLSLYSEEECAFPAAFMPRLPLLAASLRSLSIHSPAYSLDHVRALAQLVQLRHLSLSFSYEPLPAASFSLLAGLTQLQSLCLHTGSRLSWAAPAALFSLSSLTSLSLFGSTNVHESAFHLLPGLPELRRLRVSGSFSIMAGLIRGAALSPQLRCLDVRGSALTVREREHLSLQRPDLQLIDC